MKRSRNVTMLALVVGATLALPACQPIGPRLTIGGARVYEGDSRTRTLSFAVTLSQPSEKTVTVDYATADNDHADHATAGADYRPTRGSLSFSPGATTRTVAVRVKGDLVDESLGEDFLVNLSNPADANLTEPSALGTIADDDPGSGVRLTVGDAEVFEGDDGTRQVKLAVTLSEPTNGTVTVDYATADMSATAPADYTATRGRLRFSAGDTSRRVVVPVKGDLVIEGDRQEGFDYEVFTLGLSNPVNAVITDGEGFGVIRDDD